MELGAWIFALQCSCDLFVWISIELTSLVRYALFVLPKLGTTVVFGGAGFTLACLFDWKVLQSSMHSDCL